MKKGTTLMVNGDNQTAQPTISTIYAAILLKHSTFVCQIAQLEQLNNCSLKYKEMSAGGKVKAFSQVVDHHVQRFTLNRYNKGYIAIIIKTSFAAFSSSPISRTNAAEFSVNSWYTRSSWGTRRCAT